MERRIRRGEPILFDTNRKTLGTDMSSPSQSVNAVGDPTPRVNPPNFDGPTNNYEEPSLAGCGNTPHIASCSSNLPNTSATNDVAGAGDAISTVRQESSSRFAHLSWKESIKTKGRPRKRGKQVSFRRTHSDKPKQKKSKRNMISSCCSRIFRASRFTVKYEIYSTSRKGNDITVLNFYWFSSTK